LLQPLSAIRPLLLGSASPRRRELLAAAGIPIVVATPGVDESFRAGEAPEAYLTRVTEEKLAGAFRAAAASGLGITACALVADTIVELDGALVDKPNTTSDARRALELLSGRTHEVATRFAIGVRENDESDPTIVHAETVRTRVTMRALSDREIGAYVMTREGFDKAGGYGIQGGAAGFVTRIEGSYTNVVGLPLAEVIVALQKLGLWA
jgi:septum formation protein